MNTPKLCPVCEHRTVISESSYYMCVICRTAYSVATIDKYFDAEDGYQAFAGPRVTRLVTPEMRAEYFTQHGKYGEDTIVWSWHTSRQGRNHVHG